jgi:hypothetical protein
MIQISVFVVFVAMLVTVQRQLGINEFQIVDVVVSSSDVVVSLLDVGFSSSKFLVGPYPPTRRRSGCCRSKVGDGSHDKETSYVAPFDTGLINGRGDACVRVR